VLNISNAGADCFDGFFKSIWAVSPRHNMVDSSVTIQCFSSA